jgi:hypothetical protein
MPHPPQFAGSPVVSMHDPPQSLVPVGHVATQVPAEQSGVDPEHAVAHAPQWAGSVVKSTHTPLQSVWPPGHLHVGAVPPVVLHTIPPVHFTPHAPQLSASFFVSTQRPPQSVNAVGHPVVEHAPVAHDDVGPHALPHAPQLFRSVEVSVHAPPHNVRPAGQVHAPATHVSPPAHALPHAPQFALSLFKSTHAPAHAVNPVPQPATHVPPEQSGVAPEHATVHAPQFAGSVAVSTHFPPQSRVVALQVHAPAAQILSVLHAVAHVPQCVGSLFTSTHAPAQSVSPVEHAAAHAPEEHFGVAPLHAVVHEPQCVGSVKRSTHVVPHRVSPVMGQSVPPSVASFASMTSPVLVSRVSEASVASFVSLVTSACPVSEIVESSGEPESCSPPPLSSLPPHAATPNVAPIAASTKTIARPRTHPAVAACMLVAPSRGSGSALEEQWLSMSHEVLDAAAVFVRHVDERRADARRNVRFDVLLAEPLHLDDGANGRVVAGEAKGDREVLSDFARRVRRDEDAAFGEIFGEAGEEIVLARHVDVELGVDARRVSTFECAPWLGGSLGHRHHGAASATKSGASRDA